MLIQEHQAEGASRWYAYKKIAQQYQCHPQTVRGWIEPETRQRRNELASQYFQEHRKGTDRYRDERAPKRKHYNALRNNIENVIVSAVAEIGQPFTLADLTAAIAGQEGVRFRHRTLEHLFQKYAEMNGKDLLVPIKKGEYRLSRK